MVIQKTQLSLLSGYLAWAAAALFFFYQYILRVTPGVMVNELRATFYITAEQFSYFGALYLYAYSLLQMPVGLVVDKIGTKKTILFSIIGCLGGTFLLTFTSQLYVAYASRIILGAASACAFMSTLKVVADHLPQGKQGFLMGATLTLGVIGALVAGKPLSIMMDWVGWRSALLITGVIGLIVFIMVFIFVPSPEKKINAFSQDVSSNKFWLDIKSIFLNRPILMYATLAVGLYTPLSVMADLWGVAYIMSKYHVSRTEAAQVSMMMYVGLCIGSLILPWLSEKLNILNQTLKVCTWCILITFLIILLAPSLTLNGLSILLLILGLFCGAEMLCFTGVIAYAPPEKVGVTLGITNTFNVLGGAVAQQLIGFIIDRFLWTGGFDENGNRFYTSADYTTALLSLGIIILICCIVSWFLPKNTVDLKTT